MKTVEVECCPLTETTETVCWYVPFPLHQGCSDLALTVSDAAGAHSSGTDLILTRPGSVILDPSVALIDYGLSGHGENQQGLSHSGPDLSVRALHPIFRPENPLFLWAQRSYFFRMSIEVQRERNDIQRFPKGTWESI